MTPIRLILVRHGQTDWNVEHRFQGQTDIPLNATGRQQAEALAQVLQHEPIQAVITSDLQRAQATAQAIATSLKLAPKLERRMREMSFGAWEGLTYDTIQHQSPEALAAWQMEPLSVAPPDGETLTQVTHRVSEVWQALPASHPGQTIVLVAHGGPLRLLLCLALDIPPQHHWRFMINPASLSELSLYDDQGATLTRLNHTFECGIKDKK